MRLALVLLALPCVAGAQFNPRHVTGRTANSVEVALGLEALPFRDYGGARAFTTFATLRHQIDPGHFGIHATAWWLQRDKVPSAFRFSEPSFNTIFALTGALDASLPLSEDAALEPYAGGGYAGSAGSRQSVVTLGLQLRRKRLLIGQHVLVVSGADREFFPLTLGWRF